MKSNHDGSAAADEASNVRGITPTHTERFMLRSSFFTADGDRELFALAEKLARLSSKYEATSARARRITDIDRRHRYDELIGDRISAADSVLGEAAEIPASSLTALRLKAQLLEWSADSQSAATEAEKASCCNERLLWSLVRDLIAFTTAVSLSHEGERVCHKVLANAGLEISRVTSETSAMPTH